MPMRSPLHWFELRHKAQIDYANGYEGNFRTPRQKHHLQHVYVRNDSAVVRRNVVDGNCRNEKLLHRPGLRHFPTSVVDTDRNKTCEIHGGNIISTHNFGGCLSE